jgi:uncharacterized protein
MSQQRGTFRRTALVTGASRGIGRELARVLAANDHDLVLVGRDAAALQALASTLRTEHGIRVHCEACDLAQAGAAAKLWDELGCAGLVIDVLVNNAGVGVYGKMQDRSVEELESMLELNIVALAALTRLALPGMIKRRWGRILNVGSVAGYAQSGPRMAGYYASKSFVLSFSRALANELEGTGVSVTLLAPGPTSSSFEERAGAGRTRLFRYMPLASAGDVALAGYRGMQRQSPVVLPGFLAKFIAFTAQLPPRALAGAINRFLLEEATP